MTRIRIKICGITSEEAVVAAVDAGADALGFVFANSPRAVAPKRAAELARAMPPFLSKVAVFFNAGSEEIRRVLEVFPADLVQTEPIDGLERTVPLLPVFHDAEDVLDRVGRLSACFATILFEASGSGGRGAVPNWARAARIARERRLVLAGGLTPENVGGAIERVRPFAVDVSSGVESSRGIKDASLIHAFARAVREAQEEQPTFGQTENQ